MDPIQPILGVGQDPFNMAVHLPPEVRNFAPTLPPWLNPMVQGPAGIGPHPQIKPVEGPEAHEIDFAKLQSDQHYLQSTLAWVLESARTHFAQSLYQPAMEYYDQFFRYQAYYDGSPWGVGEYFPALFEFYWLQGIVGQNKEAEVFFNRQVLLVLEAAEKVQGPDALEIRQKIQALQQEEELPGPGALQMELSADALTQVAKTLVEAGEGDLARGVLGFTEVVYMVGLYQTIQMAKNIYQSDTTTRQGPVALSGSEPVLPFGFRHTGLPVAPVLPLNPAQMAQINAQYRRELPGIHVDKVEAIYGLNHDPNEEAERLRKERQVNVYRKQMKNQDKKKRSKKRRVPPPTF